MAKRRLAWVVTLSLLAAAPGAAQSPVRLSVTPLVGWIDPRGALPHARILASPLNSLSYDEVDGMGAVGAALHIDAPRRPLGVRLAFVRSFDGEETGQWGCVPAADGGPAGCPSVLILVPTAVTVTSVSASLVGRAAVGPIRLRGDVGAGRVRHHYAWDPDGGGDFSLAPGEADRSVATLNAGADVGLQVPGGRVVLRYEEIHALGGAAEGRPARWRVLGAGLELRVSR